MQIKNKATHRKGFTLVEILVVIAVIGILASISVVGYGAWKTAASTAQVKSDLNGVLSAMESARTFGNKYPLGLPSTFTPSEGVVLSGGGRTDGKSYCVSAASGGVTWRITNSNDDPALGTCVSSCYSILDAGASIGNGTYTINNNGASMQVYCDMTTSGGGWTLLVSNPGPYSVWNNSTIYSLNSSTPSISTPYSILNKADSIKSSINGKLSYKIDAVTVGSWGGVWEAPYSNTFVGTSAVANATNIIKYDSWNIDDTTDSTQSLTNIMPWISTGSALLSTWEGLGNWWGTLVAQSSGYSPSPYMTPWQSGPGKIWYWVK